MTRPAFVASCALAMLTALYVVGGVSVPPGSLRHEVQTLPLWIPIVLGYRGSPHAKWAALPCFVFWLAIMVAIWLFLLGWARIVTGHFFPTEVAMTITIGIASLAGLATIAGWRTTVRPARAVGAVVASAALQLLAFRISLLPYIAQR
jgi:hypothetical protein